jgi:hypothetical protein
MHQNTRKTHAHVCEHASSAHAKVDRAEGWEVLPTFYIEIMFRAICGGVYNE